MGAEIDRGDEAGGADDREERSTMRRQCENGHPASTFRR